MFELTDQQVESIRECGEESPRATNPRTQETFVLLRLEEYERLKTVDYDDSPWTREELEAAAWEVAERSEWDELDEIELKGDSQ